MQKTEFNEDGVRRLIEALYEQSAQDYICAVKAINEGRDSCCDGLKPKDVLRETTEWLNETQRGKRLLKKLQECYVVA